MLCVLVVVDLFSTLWEGQAVFVDGAGGASPDGVWISFWKHCWSFYITHRGRMIDARHCMLHKQYKEEESNTYC